MRICMRVNAQDRQVTHRTKIQATHPADQRHTDEQNREVRSNKNQTATGTPCFKYSLGRSIFDLNKPRYIFDPFSPLGTTHVSGVSLVGTAFLHSSPRECCLFINYARAVGRPSLFCRHIRGSVVKRSRWPAKLV